MNSVVHDALPRPLCFCFLGRWGIRSSISLSIRESLLFIRLRCISLFTLFVWLNRFFLIIDKSLLPVSFKVSLKTLQFGLPFSSSLCSFVRSVSHFSFLFLPPKEFPLHVHSLVVYYDLSAPLCVNISGHIYYDFSKLVLSLNHHPSYFTKSDW